MRATIAGMATVAGLGLSVLASAAPGSAQAARILNFSGDCADCTGQGVGTLQLTDGANGVINKADFISFAYKSNLVSFSLNSSDIVAVVGKIDANNLDKAYIDVLQLGGTGWEFIRNSDGTWSVSSEITLGAGKSKGGSSSGGGGGGGGGFSGGSGSSFNPGSSLGGDHDRTVDDFGAGSSITNVSQHLAVAVPEPTAWALMIVGFGGLGALLRRQRRTLAFG